MMPQLITQPPSPARLRAMVAEGSSAFKMYSLVALRKGANAVPGLEERRWV